MSAHGEHIALASLPPSVGDAGVAAVLLRDLAAAVGTTDRHGAVGPSSVDVDDASRFRLTVAAHAGSPEDLAQAALTAPELFDDGAVPDARSDVYAAACLALTRYLGSSPTPTVTLPVRTTDRLRRAALRQAARTAPLRLGALPEPFRAVFAQAAAKEPHLRPSPDRLVALLDAAFAALGERATADARARVHRLVVLARVFEPGGSGSVLKAPPTLTKIGELVEPAPTPSHLPLRALPAFGRPTGIARGVLVAAVTLVATGGVAAAAIAGFGSTTPTPQAIATFPAPSSTAGPTVSPGASTTNPAPAATSTAPPVGTLDGGGDGTGNGGGGSGNGGSGNGSGGGSGNGDDGSGDGGGSGNGSGGGAGTGGSTGSGGSSGTGKTQGGGSTSGSSSTPTGGGSTGGTGTGGSTGGVKPPVGGTSTPPTDTSTPPTDTSTPPTSDPTTPDPTPPSTSPSATSSDAAPSPSPSDTPSDDADGSGS